MSHTAIPTDVEPQSFVIFNDYVHLLTIKVDYLVLSETKRVMTFKPF